ncbi:hypothetical protein BR93DRAFT_931269 [Coniochaeta sp. PMI_546]|nr:hypothetical protein BR93DRAFT_931269 [Coniochaeta sp. PMI_546]
MASEIHKKRTGKGFKISEEIVMKEEMYEEEDDDLPRHYRALAAHLQTSSPDMNSRLSAYLTGQVAMASMARQKEVDKLFAESFPNAARMGQQMQQSAYFQGIQASSPQSTASPMFHSAVQPPTSSSFSDRSQAVHRPSPLSATHSHSSGASYMQSPRSQKRPSIVDSPPVLSPASGYADTSSSSTSTPQVAPPQQYTTYVAPQSLSSGNVDQPLFQSSFTSELPNDAKLLANIDMNDPLAGAFFGMSDLTGTDNFDYAQFSSSNFNTTVPDDSSVPKQLNAYGAPPTDYFHAMQPQSKFLDIPGQASRIGTPGGGEGDSWDNWIDENEWSGLDPEQRWAKPEHR